MPFDALDDDTLLAGPLSDGGGEGVRAVGNDLEAGLGVEDADRADFALRDMSCLADQRQQPARLGTVFPADRYREPDAIFEACIRTLALGRIEGRRRTFGEFLGCRPRRKLLTQEGDGDLLGAEGREEFMRESRLVLAGRFGEEDRRGYARDCACRSRRGLGLAVKWLRVWPT